MSRYKCIGCGRGITVRRIERDGPWFVVRKDVNSDGVVCGFCVTPELVDSPRPVMLLADGERLKGRYLEVVDA